jgi:GT2 family glycosyltransferase
MKRLRHHMRHRKPPVGQKALDHFVMVVTADGAEEEEDEETEQEGGEEQGAKAEDRSQSRHGRASIAAPQTHGVLYDAAVAITIAIPTYERGTVLCETIEQLLALGSGQYAVGRRQEIQPAAGFSPAYRSEAHCILPTASPAADEIVIVDQTREHPREVAARLEAWQRANAIRLIRLDAPSITRAMNTALREAKSTHVLFLDDDIIPSPQLLAAHGKAVTEAGVWAVVGQVLQPGETPAHFTDDELHRGVLRDLEFRFTHDTACDVQNVMAGNLCVDRERALSIGGFDEHYSAVAYRFETDFALRVIAGGGRIRYEPSASIRHLKAPGGGVRMWGDHRTSASPAHSMGDYYFARRHVPHFWRYVLTRLRKNVLTRFHLKHPWTIPLKVLGEIRGLLRALRG